MSIAYSLAIDWTPAECYVPKQFSLTHIGKADIIGQTSLDRYGANAGDL